MKRFRFDVSLPEGRSRGYVFYDKDRAEQRLQTFLESDPRYNPSQLKEEPILDNAIVIDENNRYVEHDITGLSFIGQVDVNTSGGTRKESWYAAPGLENEAKKEYQKTVAQQPSTNRSPGFRAAMYRAL